ncbi:hypothetical protein [Parabacteroides chinchillae]
MKVKIVGDITGLALLMALPSCGSGRQAVETQSEFIPQQEVTERRDLAVQASGLVRHKEIPMVQVDASSVLSRMINYIEPETAVMTPAVTTQQLTAYIDFPANGITINPTYGNNRAELAKLKEQLMPLLRQGNEVESIRLTGYASPDGNTKENERLAGNRAIQFKNYLLKQYKFPDNGMISIDWVGEDWDGLAKIIAKSGKPYARQVLAIINGRQDADSCRRQIRALDKGNVYKDIEKNFFSRLRRMELAVSYKSQAMVVSKQSGMDMTELAQKVYNAPDKLSLDELLQVATLYRPGTEQYREVYELAAYRFPSCKEAVLNAAAASIALGDVEAGRYFLQGAGDDPRSWNNRGVLCLMNGDLEGAMNFFRKYLPQNPRLARQNMEITKEMQR